MAYSVKDLDSIGSANGMLAKSNKALLKPLTFLERHFVIKGLRPVLEGFALTIHEGVW